MATIEVPTGRIFRTELRATISACATKPEQSVWRDSNSEIRQYVESNPAVRNPKDIARHFLEKRKRTVARAETIAKPYGGQAKDILREQAEFWLERELPDNPYLLFAHLHFGNRKEIVAAAELADLPIAIARTMAHRRKGYSYREIEGLGGALKRNAANKHWLRFLYAVETEQCVCECPHCSLNLPERRLEIARLLRRIKTTRAGTSNESDRLSSAGSENTARDRARGGNPVCNGPSYATIELGNGLIMLAHRWAWIRERGGIPSEHDVHHVDANPANNDVGNLELLPRWAHRLLHKR